MSTIGIRNQDQPNPDNDKAPENPTYPSGVSPSRTKKTPDQFALRTILSGKVSFVSAYVLEGIRTSAVSVPKANTQYGLKRVWVHTFPGDIKKGAAADRAEMQSFCDCTTIKEFNRKYTEECKKQGLTLEQMEDETLRVMARNQNYYTKVHTSIGYARLCLLYLEPNKDISSGIVGGFTVQCLRIHDNTTPTHFAYAQAIIGRTLDQLSFEQEQRYNAALERSKLINKQLWHEWDSLHVEEQNGRVNALLREFNNGTQLGDVH